MASRLTSRQTEHDTMLLKRSLMSSCAGCQTLDDQVLAGIAAEVRAGLRKPVTSWWEMAQALVCIAGAGFSAVLMEGAIRNAEQFSTVQLAIIVAIVVPSAYLSYSLALRLKTRGERLFVEAAGHALEVHGIHCEETPLQSAARTFLWQRYSSVRFVVAMQVAVVAVFLCALTLNFQEDWLDIYIASFIAVLCGTGFVAVASFAVGLCLWSISQEYGAKAIKLMAVLGLALFTNLYMFAIVGAVYMILRGMKQH